MVELPKVDLESKDLVAERIEQLKELFPEIATEGNGSIDFERLRLILGDVIADDDERYTFMWPGKTDAIRQSQAVTTSTLRPKPESSVNWDETENLYIEGDNLEVLKLLQRAYFGKVKLIYIDPPYNTGHDFVYHDDFGDTISNYRAQAGLAGQSNADTSGRFHSDWCSMMYPRLRLARELLRDDGVIFISIDDNEQGNLRKLCDEIFGDSNYLTCITRATGTPTGGGFDGLVNELDYMLVYAKDISKAVIYGLPMSEEDSKIYDQEDEYGRFLTRSLRRTGGEDRREDRPTMYFPIIAPDGTDVYPIGPTGYESRWICAPETVKRMEENHLLAWKKVTRGGVETWHPYQKFYLENRTKAPGNLWTSEEGNKKATRDVRDLFDKVKVFDFPKPIGLIEKVVRIATQADDIILDFFSGSATTAHAIMRLNAEDGQNRHYILVQLPELCAEGTEARKAGFDNLCQLGEERIRRAGARIIEDINAANRQLRIGDESKPTPDVGFRVFALDDSGIERPRDGQLLIDRIKAGRTDLDIVYEMMIKWGLELTYPIEKDQIEGYPIYSVAGNDLICCMEPGLTTDVLEAIAELLPRRVFLLDSVIDDTIKLNALQIFKRVEERTQQKIDLRTV